MLFSNSISMMIHVVNVAGNIAGTIQPVGRSIYHNHMLYFENGVVRQFMIDLLFWANIASYRSTSTTGLE
jgi:hypothetical protein